MDDQRSDEMVDRAFAIRPVLTAWALVLGADLFFNAGVFVSVFDQEREPSLLGDEVLFRRIPVAYLALLAGVTFLAWIIDGLDVQDTRRGVIVGSLSGVVFSLMGVVYLWTAIEMTVLFVAVGSLVVIVEFASAGWALSALRPGPSDATLTRRVLLIALLAAVAGIIIQNFLA